MPVPQFVLNKYDQAFFLLNSVYLYCRSSWGISGTLNCDFMLLQWPTGCWKGVLGPIWFPLLDFVYPSQLTCRSGHHQGACFSLPGEFAAYFSSKSVVFQSPYLVRTQEKLFILFFYKMAGKTWHFGRFLSFWALVLDGASKEVSLV